MSCRCLVVGAGIIGSALAARLAESGAEVTIVDSSELGSGTTYSSLAWINSNGKPPRAYHDLNVAGMQAWREWAAQLGTTWLKTCGSLHWMTPEEGHRFVSHVQNLAAWDYPVQVLKRHQASELEPHLLIPPDVQELAYFPDEAYLDTAPALRTLLDCIADSGGTVIASDAVIELLVAGDRVNGVRMASGTRIEADMTVICAGWRTPELAAQLDIEIPLVPVDSPGSAAPCLVAYTTPGPDLLSRLVCAPDLLARPAGRGRLFLEADIYDERVDLTTDAGQLEACAAGLLDWAKTLLSGLADTEIAEYRVCIRPLPADGYPIIGRPSGIEGCYLVVTHSGVTLAAHLATLAAAEILTDTDHPTLGPYRPDRFQAGSGMLTTKTQTETSSGDGLRRRGQTSLLCEDTPEPGRKAIQFRL
jgi:glycine/D-amino acid oxidase-like deaminating enzyme